MDRLSQMELFVRIGEYGSISKAADKVGLSVSAASRHLTAMEERLGVRLIERTTRRLRLTEAGQGFLKDCQAALLLIEEAEGSVTEAAVEPSGLLRVTSSSAIASDYIAPFIKSFCERYPRISIDLVIANRYPDFIEAGIDVAIRTTQYEPDSSIAVRRLASTLRVMAASPDYLQRHGTPADPADLQRHTMLVYALATEPYELRLHKGETHVVVSIGRKFQCDDNQVIRAAGVHGAGIVIQPLFVIRDQIVEGSLVPVLADWQLPILNVHIAFQSRRYPPAKIRVFADELQEWFGQMQWMETPQPLANEHRRGLLRPTSSRQDLPAS